MVLLLSEGIDVYNNICLCVNTPPHLVLPYVGTPVTTTTQFPHPPTMRKNSNNLHIWPGNVIVGRFFDSCPGPKIPVQTNKQNVILRKIYEDISKYVLK